MGQRVQECISEIICAHVTLCFLGDAEIYHDSNNHPPQAAAGDVTPCIAGWRGPEKRSQGEFPHSVCTTDSALSIWARITPCSTRRRRSWGRYVRAPRNIAPSIYTLILCVCLHFLVLIFEAAPGLYTLFGTHFRSRSTICKENTGTFLSLTVLQPSQIK